MGSPLVTNLRLFPGSWDDQRRGLLGYLQFRVADLLVVDGATLRQTLDGRVVISWPTRRDAAGVEHSIVRPVDAATRRAIEQELLAQLGDMVPGGAA